MPTYYVDAATGSDSDTGLSDALAWQTLAKVHTAATDGTLVDGDTVEFLSGAYSLNVQFAPTVAGITLRSRVKHGAVITFGAAMPDVPKFRITKHRWTIDGFEITQTTKGTGNGDKFCDFWTNGETVHGATNTGSYGTVKNCKIHNGIEPLKTYLTLGVTFENNIVYNCRYAMASFNAYGTIFRNNEIYDFDADAIQTKGGTRDALIYGNLVRVTKNVSGSLGKNSGITVGGSAGAGVGGGVDQPPIGWGGNNIACFSNVVQTEGVGVTPYAIIIQAAKDSLVAYNTIIGRTAGSISSAAFLTKHSAGTGWSNTDSGGAPRPVDPEFRGNVVYRAARLWIAAGNANTSYQGAGVDDRNHAYLVTTLTDMPNATAGGGTATTSNRGTSDPQLNLVSTTFASSDLRPADASPLRGAGVPITHTLFSGSTITINTDYVGVTRGPTWDLGAYHMTPLPVEDSSGGGTTGGFGAFVGEITVPTSTGNVSYTGYGPDIKALIAVPTNRTADGAGANLCHGFGFATGSGSDNQFCTGVWGDDAAATSAYRRAGSNASIVRIYQASAVILEASLVSIDADGFTLNWSTIASSPDMRGVRVRFTAFGGTELLAKVKTFARATSVSSQAITGVGFQPVFGLLMGYRSASVPSNNTQANMILGAATASAQWAIGEGANTAQATGDSGRYQTSSLVAVETGFTGSPVATASRTSFDADGFTLNWTLTSDVTANQYAMLCLGGIQAKVGSISIPGSTGAQATTGIGFQPGWLGLFGIGTATSGTTVADWMLSTGMATGPTARYASWSSDDDPADPTVDKTAKASDAIYVSYSQASTPVLQNKGDVTTFDADGWTLDWENAGATGHTIWYAVLGALPVVVDPEEPPPAIDEYICQTCGLVVRIGIGI